MFCYQCKYDSYSRFCRIKAICAKSPTSSAIEEFLLRGIQSLSIYVHKIKYFGGNVSEFNDIALKILYLSINNTTSDNKMIIEIISELNKIKDIIKDRYMEIAQLRGFSVDIMPNGFYWNPKENLSEVMKEGEKLLFQKRQLYKDEVIYNLRELLVYALRGVSQNAQHSKNLGAEDVKIYDFISDSLYLLTNAYVSEQELKSALIRAGEINYNSLKLLDNALIERYGKPEPTKVKISKVKGKAVLVSGNDIKDLESVLTLTQSKKINVYTYGEMVLAHCYPELRQFSNLIGNYGDIRVENQLEVESFPGPVLIDASSFYDPTEIYRGRVFTTNVPFWKGVDYVGKDNFEKLASSALDAEGFTESEPEKFIDISFGEDKLSLYIEKIKELCSNGKIRHIFLVSGCNILEESKEYVCNFIKSIPKDCIAIKFSGLQCDDQVFEIGEIEGVPRLIDIGIYENFYSMMNFIDVMNGLLTSEKIQQKASVIVYWNQDRILSTLLSFYSLGIRNLKIGSCNPINMPPSMIEIFKEKFGIKVVSGDVKKDIDDFLEGK